MRIDAYNAQPGREGSYPCPICKGKGVVYFIRDGAIAGRECQCLARRRSEARARRSGIGEAYDLYTLDRYTATLPWQQAIRDKALEYLERKRGWFFVSGRSGSGKTHITFAITRSLIEAGYETRCFLWRTDGARLKALMNEPGGDAALREYAECRVLLIDDFWKGGAVTPADVNLAFALLNGRYNAPSRLTILSSELDLNTILTIDEAVGGRIVERASGFILRTGDENLRLGRIRG